MRAQKEDKYAPRHLLFDVRSTKTNLDTQCALLAKRK